MGNQQASFCCKSRWLNSEKLSADKLKMLNDIDNYAADASEHSIDLEGRKTPGTRISGTSTIMFH